MDVVVKGHHCEVTERFRQHVEDKLARVERLQHNVIRMDVEVSQEANPRRSEQAERIQLTMHSRGPVIRAEAAAGDRYAALDQAVQRLESQLRRAADRRRVHHGSRTPLSVAEATAAVAATLESGDGRGDFPALADGPGDVTKSAPDDALGGLQVEGDGPLVVREKTHQATPMSLDQALYEMELVGHDFYLFVDADSRMPSVVYRRRGYDYGVIRLAV